MESWQRALSTDKDASDTLVRLFSIPITETKIYSVDEDGDSSLLARRNSDRTLLYEEEKIQIVGLR